MAEGSRFGNEAVITDKLKSYGSAKREIMPGVEHRQHKGLNSARPNNLTVPCEPNHKTTWRFPLWI